MRDFTVIIRNKVRQGKHRIGYLPVEQINEGPPLECTDQTPQNAATEPMHQRMQLIASRLDKRQTEAAEAMPSAIMPSEGWSWGSANLSEQRQKIIFGDLSFAYIINEVE